MYQAYLPGMNFFLPSQAAFITRQSVNSKQQFVDKRTLFWRYKSRKGIDDVFLEPAEKPFTGKLIILIDERSSSSSEEFSGGMNAIDKDSQLEAAINYITGMK